MSRVPTNRVPPGESVIDRAPGTPAAYTSIRNPGGSLIFSNGSSAPRPRAATSRTTKTRADPRLALRHNPGWIRVMGSSLPPFPHFRPVRLPVPDHLQEFPVGAREREALQLPRRHPSPLAARPDPSPPPPSPLLP